MLKAAAANPLPDQSGHSGEFLTTNGTTASWTANGSGDVTGPAASVDSEIVLFNGTTGKVIKRASGTGYVKVTSGVMGSPSATIPNTDITGLGTISTQNANSVTITGGSITGATITGNITGNASTATALQTARAIYGNNFDGTAALTQIIGSAFGGTANGFTKFSGATTTEKTYTLPDASAAILTDNAAVSAAQGGTGIASYAVGDIIYASGTATLAKLADVATGNALISGGITTAPSWGKIGLTTHVSGTLGSANGGTGVANNAASTITISGNFGTTITVSGTTSVTLPTSGTLVASGSSPTFSTITASTTIKNNGIPLQQNYQTANSSTAYTIDPINNGGYKLGLTLNGVAPVLTLGSLPAANLAIEIEVDIIQDGTGGRVPSWASVTWVGGVAPPIATAIGAVTPLKFIATSAGWLGFAIGGQNPANVGITGGAINGCILGATTPMQIQGFRPVNTQTGTTYITVLSDCGKQITMNNGSASTLTIPPHSDVAYVAQTEMDIAQLGAGQVTITPGAGVTILSYTSLTKMAGQYAGATIKQTATQDTWLLVGNLSA